MRHVRRTPDPISLFAQGHELLRRRRVSSALRFFTQAQAHGFDTNECAAARWKCWMLAGHFERAWAECDMIASTNALDPNGLWDGTSWCGKRVMLRGLHGLGDTLQFIRYAPLVARTAKTVVAQVHPQLVTSIQQINGIDRVYTWTKDPELDCCRDWDLQMEVTELPRAFKSNLRSLPSSVPYLTVPELRCAWAKKVVGRTKGLRVGLSWQTGPWDYSRSIPTKFLERLLRVSGCDFFSLQKDADVSHWEQAGILRDLEIHSSDILDTGALAAQMDLIITADTMTAHLAGALAKPVWILLPFEADWRWMLGTERSPWYPTARLFRQSQPGDWDGVMAEVVTYLSTLKSLETAM